MRGGFSRYIARGPGSQEGACEYLKGPIALAMDVLFCFGGGVFLVYLENNYVKFTYR